MKGIVFTEFLELVEDKFGLEMVDSIIESSNLESKGVYTSVGTYSFSEMLQLLQHLSKNTGLSIDNLLLVYGEHFFSVLENSYPGLLATENHIHVEVRKIYPDAELPTFEVIEKSKKSLTMIYKSSRAMHHFGLGLMNKTFEHFNSTATIALEKIEEDGTKVKFVINKNE